MPADLISEALVLPPHVPTYLDPPYGIDDFAHSVWGSLYLGNGPARHVA